MTLNLHRGTDESGTNRLAENLALFNTQRPDLIALQEVESGHLKAFLAAGYQVIFGANLNFISFHFGNAILTRRPILYHRHHYLPGRLEPRGLDEVALEISGHTVTILNTHLGLERRERAGQFAEIQRIIGNLSGPVILVGDFNAGPGDDLFAGLRGLFWETGAPEAKTFPASRPVSRFDQIWYNDFWRLVRENVLPWLGSDHLPVLAELQLVKGNPASQAEPSLPALTQNSIPALALSEFDSPELQVGVEKGAGSELNQGWAGVLFPINRHWIISAGYQIISPQHSADGAKCPESGLRVFRVGYSPGSFDLRDYFSLLRVKGYGRWTFYVCAGAAKELWMEWNQAYRWNTRWETGLTLAIKGPETIWRLEQSIYLTKCLSYSISAGARNNLTSSLTYILP
ncbi:MAG: endonuclease/exonuclease/phosphatase family protein [Firmicutes bacterium]|nr:endonuclease/exonuclease/phosphatase family protein [Bacillota bacterium]